MAGDFFSEIAKAWQDGLKRSANMPSLGPKVGRGFFSAWGLSERDRELHELVALHAELEAQHDALLAGPLKDRMGLICRIVVGAWRTSGTPYCRAISDAVFDLVDRLLIEEFYWFPHYDDPCSEIAAFSLKARVDLRAYLLRKQRLFLAFDKRLGVLEGLLVHLAARILEAIPDRAETGAEVGESALSLDLTVAGLIEGLAPLLDEIVMEVCSNQDRAFNSELLVDCREQAMLNLALASNINPNDPAPSKPYILPSGARFEAPGELVRAYLRHTPFEALFEAPVPIHLPDTLRCEHALIVGGSGHGKSQLLLKLIHHDLARRDEDAPGVIVIDSQGDLIETLSRLPLFDPDRPNNLADRLILIDPGDVEFPVALNLFAFDQDRLESYSRADRERVLNSLIDLYDYFFTALLGAELTQKQGVVFRYLARLMMEIPDATLQTLRALMEDGRPFKPYMQALDGSAKHFFKTEFFSPGFAATKKQILRRLWGVLANPVFERMFSHPENRVDVFQAMNDGKIILINTAKDLLKTEGCSIFGRFFIAKIAQASLERATIGEDERRPVNVYIDEAHDYFDETLDQLFNQARKYRVGLNIAAQHLDQMPQRLRSTVMASTAIKLAGGVSAKDARALAEDMRADAAMIQSMRKRRGQSEFALYAKGVTERAMRMEITLGEVSTQASLDDETYTQILTQNRARYCSTLSEIEALINAEDEGVDQDASSEAHTRSSTVPQRETSQEPNSKPQATPSPPVAKLDEDPKEPPVSPAQGATPTAKQEPPEDVTETRKAEIDAYVQGVGGRQHKRLQQWVRELAHARGFKATIEQPVLDGRSVDVGLEHDEHSIAIEISITNTAEYELSNILKGFEAGFDEVFLIVPDPARRSRYQRDITAGLDEAYTATCKVIGPDELSGLLDERAAKAASDETVVRGWRVSTHYSPVSPEEAKFRREAVARAIAESSRKPSTDE